MDTDQAKRRRIAIVLLFVLCVLIVLWIGVGGSLGLLAWAGIIGEV